MQVLGMELERARAELTRAGREVTCAQTSSKKGVAGNEARVVRQREIPGGKTELLYAIFKTDCDMGG